MSAEPQHSFEYFQHESLRLLQDSCGRLVSIPTGSGQEGYLAVNRESGKHSQVRFLKSGDGKTQAAFRSIWNSFLKVEGSEICPQVEAVTVFDAMPCCITSLPKGEPVNHFVNRNGDLPPEVAVRLVLEFAKSIRTHNPTFYRQFAISPESVWIARTSGQPRLVLGEISPVNHPDPEAHNVELCIELLKYLTGNPLSDSRFQRLLNQLSSGPRKLEFIERSLECFAEANPAANYWMGFNDPACLLERIITAESAARLAARDAENALVETAKKSFWPALIATTIAVGAFMTFCIIKFAGDPDLQIQKIEKPRVQYVRQAPPVKVYQKAVQPAPAKVVKAPVAKQKVVVQPAEQTEVVVIEDAPVSNPRVTPLLKSILADTGDLFEGVKELPKSEWLIPTDPEKNTSKKQLTSFTAEDARALKILELKKAATEAKANNQIFEAIHYEVALLRFQPDSIDARIRLHDYLCEVQHMAINRNEISNEEVEILVEASQENAKAKDILTQHYWKVAQQNF